MLSRWLPKNISTVGAELDFMFEVVFWLTGIVFIGVAVAMIYFLFKYRDKGDGRRATYSHGNNTLEIVWTVIPSVIFICLGIWSEGSWAKIKKSQPDPDLTVQVTGRQFNWEIVYPGPDGVSETYDFTNATARAKKDDYKTQNVLTVPVNRNINLLLNADDVIHSFFLPHVRLKQDTLPGREIIMWFNATETGEYEIACAELCGIGHTTMNGTLKVLSEADWKAWVKETRPLMQNKKDENGKVVLDRDGKKVREQKVDKDGNPRVRHLRPKSWPEEFGL